MVLSKADSFRFSLIHSFYRITGFWRYPVPTEGDYEFMQQRDLIYWLYKAQHPITHAVRGSGIEEFFARQAFSPPDGFIPETSIELSAVGDLMNHLFLSGAGDTLYGDVEDLIFDVDLSMGNLECVVYHSEDRSFQFDPGRRSSPPLYFGADGFHAAKGGRRSYDYLTVANNHCLDFGEEGVQSTLEALRSEGIVCGGLNETDESASSATILDRQGIRLGIIAFTFGLNGKRPPADRPWLVNRMHLLKDAGEIDFSALQRQIDHCRANDVDFIIAQLHWGLEHEYYPRPQQIELARILAEMGIDLLIGHHPHVPQPVEYYRTRRDCERIVPIFYSLGNLITPFSDPRFCESGVARVTLSRGRDRAGRSRTYVSDARAVSVYMQADTATKELRIIKTLQNQARG